MGHDGSVYLFNIGIKLLIGINLLNKFLELFLAQQSHSTLIKLKLLLLEHRGTTKDLIGGHVRASGEGRTSRRHRDRHRLRNLEICRDGHPVGLLFVVHAGSSGVNRKGKEEGGEVGQSRKELLGLVTLTKHRE